MLYRPHRRWGPYRRWGHQVRDRSFVFSNVFWWVVSDFGRKPRESRAENLQRDCIVESTGMLVDRRGSVVAPIALRCELGLPQGAAQEVDYRTATRLEVFDSRSGFEISFRSRDLVPEVL